MIHSCPVSAFSINHKSLLFVILPLFLSFFLPFGFFSSTQSSISQRDRDRERAQARATYKAKQPRDDGLTPEQRRERDAKALQEKLARKAAQAGGNNDNTVGNKTGIKNK